MAEDKKDVQDQSEVTEAELVSEQVEEDLSSDEDQNNVTEMPKIDTVEQKLARSEQDLLYLKAEFENFRKRILREQDQKVKFANEKIIQELLNVSSNFDLALTHAKKINADGDVKTFVDGIKMTHHELEQMLIRFGVEFVGEKGEAFDPLKHEALSQEPVSEELNNKITQVIKRGCKLGGRLLEPSKVIIGTYTKTEASEE